MIRRIKSEVLTQLPEKIRKIIHLKLPDLKKHEQKKQEARLKMFEGRDKVTGIVFHIYFFLKL